MKRSTNGQMCVSYAHFPSKKCFFSSNLQTLQTFVCLKSTAIGIQWGVHLVASNTVLIVFAFPLKSLKKFKGVSSLPVYCAQNVILCYGLI